MAHQFALGAAIHVISNNATPLDQRQAGDATPHLLVLICHGLFVTDIGSGAMTTGPTPVPMDIEVRFSVEHGRTADTDDLAYCLKELVKNGVGDVERLWPDRPAEPAITNYHLGKGTPKPGSPDVAEWFRSEDAKALKASADPDWAGLTYATKVLGAHPGNTLFDIARIRKAARNIGDVFLAMTAPHAYTHLLCHVCREEIRVKS